MSALTRVLRSLGGEEALDRLARLPGSDLTSVLLALMRRRADALSGPDVLRQYKSDRFAAPSEVPFDVLRAALALEAAVRRQTGPDDVRLAAVQRVVRAQLFSGAGRFAHFTLFAAVSAGRDRGSLSFERQHFAELPADPSRRTGYYKGLCFKVFRDGVEIGDGGFVDWTQRLTGNRKERLLISGLGVDRFATL